MKNLLLFLLCFFVFFCVFLCLTAAICRNTTVLYAERVQRMMIIDTHCHLNHKKLAEDIPGVLARAEAVGVGRLIVVGFDMPSSEEAVRIAVHAAEESKQYALMIKLSNDIAAVHRNKDEIECGEKQGPVWHPPLTKQGPVQ